MSAARMPATPLPACCSGIPAQRQLQHRDTAMTSTRITSAATSRTTGGLRSTISVNLGVRYEFEQGLLERNNAFTVGFDRDRPFPIQVPGLTLRGGLMYAGVDGYPTHQGDPSQAQSSARAAGIAWSLDARTVVRGGYGLFWAPHADSAGARPGGARHARVHRRRRPTWPARIAGSGRAPAAR